MDTQNEQSVGQTRKNEPSQGVAAVAAGSDSLDRELAETNGMLRYTLTQQIKRLRKLADEMEAEGRCLKILGTTEKRIPHAFSRGAEMCGAADMARNWAENLEALLPNVKDEPRDHDAK
jgi:acyl-CoA reductase-like NAD-dependent aldehyde dehydrogenase